MKKPNNKQRSAIMALVFMALLSVGSSLFGQQTFSTTIYFDYTYYLSKSGPKTMAPPNTPNFKNNFFTFRRAYFTYENKINDNLKFRFRIDSDYVTALDKSDKPDDRLRPFIKHLYLEWSNFLPKATLKAGMADTLTFKIAEDKWGFRSVAKTLLDGYKDVTGKDIDATSADLGASLAGTVSKELRYAVMVTNGAGYNHPEGDKHKKIAAQVQVIPLAGFSLVGYVDYEKQSPTANAMTYKADAYLEMVKGLVLGAEYFSYKNGLNLTAAGTKYDVSGFSLFGRCGLIPDKLNAFARYDSYDPNAKVDKDGTSLVIAGLDWAPLHSSFKLQPNVWFTSYQDSAKKSDVIFNLTFFLSF
jgi:hypothetical protein